MSKRMNRSATAIGILAALVLVAWWIRCEGRRARRAIQVAPAQSKIGSEAVVPSDKAAEGRPADLSGSVGKQSTVARAVDVKPVVAPEKKSVEDFDLKDHDVFPGLAPPSASKTRNKESNP